jgi:adenylylsulfate kinase
MSEGAIVWLTGRPSSGKSTLALAVAERLRAARIPCAILDGDEVRAALVPPRGYGPEERDHQYATLTNLAALLAAQGLVVLVPATAHLRRYRDAARGRAARVLEVYVDADLAECARRDTKGLYRAARAGEIAGLPGVDAPYEPPGEPDVTVHGAQDGPGVDALVAHLVSPLPER